MYIKVHLDLTAQGLGLQLPKLLLRLMGLQMARVSILIITPKAFFRDMISFSHDCALCLREYLIYYGTHRYQHCSFEIEISVRADYSNNKLIIIIIIRVENNNLYKKFPRLGRSNLLPEPPLFPLQDQNFCLKL